MDLLPSAIAFKDVAGHDLKAEFNQIDGRLRAVLFLAAGISLSMGVPLVVTTLMRTTDEQRRLYPLADPLPTSVHQVGRGADCRVIHAPIPTVYGHQLADRINELLTYRVGDRITVALFEGPPARAPHVHLQVPSSNDSTLRCA